MSCCVGDCLVCASEEDSKPLHHVPVRRPKPAGQPKAHEVTREYRWLFTKLLICGKVKSHGPGRGPLFAAREWATKGCLHYATSDIASRESSWFEGTIIADEDAADTVPALLQLGEVQS